MDSIEFVQAAREYCDFVENAESMPLDRRLDAARRALLALYRAALELPAGALDSGPELPVVTRPDAWPGFDDQNGAFSSTRTGAIDALRALHRACRSSA